MEGVNYAVYEKICGLILSGELKPGEKLSEVKLAEQLGVSRTPVREALRQLARSGLINLFPKRFVQVANYTDKDLREIGTLRISLDLLALKLAMYYGSKADFLKLRDIAVKCYEAGCAGEKELHARYDSDFHRELARLSQNPFVIKYMDELALLIRYIVTTHYDLMQKEDSKQLKEHFVIVDAMLAGDEQGASEALLHHLLSFYHLDQYYPEHFFSV